MNKKTTMPSKPTAAKPAATKAVGTAAPKTSGKKVEQGDTLTPEEEARVDAAWLAEVNKSKTTTKKSK